MGIASIAASAAIGLLGQIMGSSKTAAPAQTDAAQQPLLLTQQHHHHHHGAGGSSNIGQNGTSVAGGTAPGPLNLLA